MVVKERRTKILLSLFIFSDSESEFVLFNDIIQKIFDLSFNQKTRGTISGMLKEGLIEKSHPPSGGPISQSQANPVMPKQNIQIEAGIEGAADNNAYKLTKKGYHALCLEFPFFRFLQDKWDGKWRVLSYEIPEKKRELRDRLRRRVSGWGLGPWHRSFWLTPQPIIENLRQLVSQKEEEKYIQAFESEHVFGDRETLIEKVWQKTTLDKKYRELFKKWHDILSGQDNKLDKLRKVIDNYILILKIDPGLPKELMGENWIGFESFSIFKEIRSILLG